MVVLERWCRDGGLNNLHPPAWIPAAPPLAFIPSSPRSDSSCYLASLWDFSALECFLGCGRFTVPRKIQYEAELGMDGTGKAFSSCLCCWSSARCLHLNTSASLSRRFLFKGVSLAVLVSLSLPFVKTSSGCGDSTHTLQIHLLCGFCYYYCTWQCPSRLWTGLCNQLHYNNEVAQDILTGNRQMEG